MAASDKTVCAITAAMQHGTGLDQFASEFSSRFFDVGIAEGHAVCMARRACQAGDEAGHGDILHVFAACL